MDYEKLIDDLRSLLGQYGEKSHMVNWSVRKVVTVERVT